MYAGTGPYKCLEDLPRPVMTFLSPQGQRVYLEAFNRVLPYFWGDTWMSGRYAWDKAKKAEGFPTREVRRRAQRKEAGLPLCPAKPAPR